MSGIITLGLLVSPSMIITLGYSAGAGAVTGDSLGLDVIGASVTLRKISATHWGIV